MKTFEFRPHVHGHPKSKIILIMKICTFILLVFNLGLSASGYSQQKKVTLDFKNATSKEFFAEIQKQTGYCFIFNTNQGEQIGEITISVRNKSVQEVMEEILRPTEFSYTFQNDIIVITPKMAEPEKNILTGLVFDENKQPLPGVTVLVKGSSNGVTTNTKGEFSIKSVNSSVIHCTHSSQVLRSRNISVPEKSGCSSFNKMTGPYIRINCA